MLLKTALCVALALVATSCETSPSSRADGLPMGLDIEFIDQVTHSEDANTNTDAKPSDTTNSDLAAVDQRVDTTMDASINACPTGVSVSTVALYFFEGSSRSSRVTDETGDHHGTMVGDPLKISGPTDCDSALSFPTGAYATLPASSAWDLSEGSISFWARFGAPAAHVSQGVISRDAKSSATGSQQGHFTILRDGRLGGRIILRLQDAADKWYIFCSNQVVPLNTWTKIAVNFGPPQVELYVDGELANNSDSLTITFDSTYPDLPCNPSYGGGIDGNNEPWILGGSATDSAQKSVLPSSLPMVEGAIDHLRISSIRRDFSN